MGAKIFLFFGQQKVFLFHFFTTGRGQGEGFSIGNLEIVCSLETGQLIIYFCTEFS